MSPRRASPAPTEAQRGSTALSGDVCQYLQGDASVEKGGEAPFDRAEGAQKGGEVSTHSRCINPAAHYRKRYPTSAGWVCRICDEGQSA